MFAVVDERDHDALRSAFEVALDVLLVVHADADDGRGAGEFGGSDHVFGGLVVHDSVFAVDDDEVETCPAHEFDQCGGGPTYERAESGAAVEHLSLHRVGAHGLRSPAVGLVKVYSRCFRLIQLEEFGNVLPYLFSDLAGVS